MCWPIRNYNNTLCLIHSSLAGIWKKKAWNSLCRSCDHQDSLSLLGEEQELNVTTAAKCEAYVSSLYTASTKTGTADELRYLMFCQKKQKNEMLPPTSDCLLQHLKQANYQAFVWRHSVEAMQDLESPEGHGWVRDRELIVLLLITKSPAPESLLELTTCTCKTSVCL